jgi:hypothetical protein
MIANQICFIFCCGLQEIRNSYMHIKHTSKQKPSIVNALEEQ